MRSPGILSCSRPTWTRLGIGRGSWRKNSHSRFPMPTRSGNRGARDFSARKPMPQLDEHSPRICLTVTGLLKSTQPTEQGGVVEVLIRTVRLPLREVLAHLESLTAITRNTAYTNVGFADTEASQTFIWPVPTGQCLNSYKHSCLLIVSIGRARLPVARISQNVHWPGISIRVNATGLRTPWDLKKAEACSRSLCPSSSLRIDPHTYRAAAACA